VDTKAMYSEIGKRLRMVRNRKSMSQQQVGIALGVTRAAIANIEAGNHRILLEHIYNAALLFNVPARELLP
jgi:transcriptional regulator with XRE-family HTH domain